MSIQTATEAAEMVAAALVLERVLDDITFAASRGQCSWVFTRLSDEIQAELRERGFRLIDTGNHITIQW